jgi:hypothetical protein
MTHYTGISIGQQLTPEQATLLKNSRSNYLSLLQRFEDREFVRYLSREQRETLDQQKADSLRVLDKYRHQECGGPANNAAVYVSCYVQNQVVPVRTLLLWVPRVCREMTMLPKIYETVADHLEPGEFIEQIELF